MGYHGDRRRLSIFERIIKCIGNKKYESKTFMNLERLVGNAWMDSLSDVLEENGRESLKLAIHKDRFINDFFWTKVICDGGWNKRSKGHDYTAKGCVEVIIDAFTKKLLYVGIKNKYCYLCFSSKKANQKVKDHVCFMHYNGPSKSLETDILVEGFRQSEAMHNLQYLQYIGDGDSSVFLQAKTKCFIRVIYPKIRMCQSRDQELYEIPP